MLVLIFLVLIIIAGLQVFAFIELEHILDNTLEIGKFLEKNSIIISRKVKRGKK